MRNISTRTSIGATTTACKPFTPMASTRMEVLDWQAIFCGERDVSPQVSDRAARLQPAHHIAFRQVLVFQAYRRMGKDSSFFQHPQLLS